METTSSGNGRLGCLSLALLRSPSFSSGICIRLSNLQIPPSCAHVSYSFLSPVLDRSVPHTVAFCFYNISSIVNGLVYFDQVSVLPTSPLLLVTVGILILLGGVWVVSIQAVNIGTWSTEDDIDVPLLEGGATEGECIPAIVESNVSPTSPETPERDRVRSHTTASESAISPPTSPSIPRRRSHHHAGQSTLGVATATSPSVPVPTPGFSIGLSPVSPGFALVPCERRRCTRAQSGRDRWDDIIGRVRTRQVASDGDTVGGGEDQQNYNLGAGASRPG